MGLIKRLKLSKSLLFLVNGFAATPRPRKVGVGARFQEQSECRFIRRTLSNCCVPNGQSQCQGFLHYALSVWVLLTISRGTKLEFIFIFIQSSFPPGRRGGGSNFRISKSPRRSGRTDSIYSTITRSVPQNFGFVIPSLPYRGVESFISVNHF